MECDKCGEDKPDVLLRAFDDKVLKRTGFVRLGPTGAEFTYTPALCTDCCAQMPDRAWMKRVEVTTSA